tara:strand:+ start:390677 stop:390988 length:312 start_codon:yes stop_codon:yes gene_type:complete
MSERRATILTADYKSESDLMIWTLRFHDNDEEQSFCWPSRDYLEHVVNISVPKKFVIDENLIKQLSDHCEAMKGKEVNFDVRKEINNPLTDIAKELSSGSIEE